MSSPPVRPLASVRSLRATRSRSALPVLACCAILCTLRRRSFAYPSMFRENTHQWGIGGYGESFRCTARTPFPRAVRDPAGLRLRSLLIERLARGLEAATRHGWRGDRRAGLGCLCFLPSRCESRRSGAQAPPASESDRAHRRRADRGARRASARIGKGEQGFVRRRRPPASGHATAPSGLLQLLDFRRHVSNRAGHHRTRKSGSLGTARRGPARQYQVRRLQSHRFHPRRRRLVRSALSFEAFEQVSFELADRLLRTAFSPVALSFSMPHLGGPDSVP